MISNYTKVKHIYIVYSKTDMCRSSDGLAAIIVDQYELYVYSDALFLFYFVMVDLIDSKLCVGMGMGSSFSTKDLEQKKL